MNITKAHSCLPSTRESPKLPFKIFHIHYREIIDYKQYGESYVKILFQGGMKKMQIGTPQPWKTKTGQTLIPSEKQCETKGFQQRLLQRLKR